MAIERVREYFSKYGMEDRVMEYEESSATVDLAAKALNCKPEHITKIDNAKYKKQFGEKAAMLTPEETLELVGHAVGGVCPFAVNEGVEVYLDISLKRFETVFPACGSSNSAIELTIPELEQHSGFIEWVDVCKNWQ